MSTSAIFLILLPFAVFLIIGMPVAFTLIATSAIYLAAKGVPFDLIAHRLCFSLDSFPLMAIPLFILAGKLMNIGGISDRIYNFASAVVGHIRGGLGHVNIVGSVIFAGMSGTALADLGGMGQMEVRAMTNAGYKKDFSAAITLASATIGPIIPPSVPFIIYGTLAEVSVTKLFLAGFLPGIVMALLLGVAVYFYAIKHNCPTTPRPSLKKIGSAFLGALPAMLSPAIIIGGMMTGIFSPTEAAGIAVVYGLFLGGLVYKELTFAKLAEITKETVKASAMLMFIIAAALLFSWVISVERIPQTLAQWIMMVGNTPFKFMTLVVVILLILGMFMENNAIMLLMIPILVPSAVALGIDPVQLGVVMCLCITIGLLTPPIGLALYVMQDIADLSFGRTVKAITPFLIPLFIALLLITYIPQITMFLPNLLLAN